MAHGVEWDMDTRIEAAIAWLITGSIDKASKLCNIPPRTIRDWTKTEWWEDVIREAQTIKQKEIDARWTGLIHTATEQLQDRIDNGETVIDKFGKERKLPIKAKELAIILSIAVDKRAVSRGQATRRIENITVDQRLDKIKKKLEEVDEDKGTIVANS